MAVTIISSPPAVSFVGNPMVFKVQAETYLNGAAANAVTEVGLASGSLPADIIVGDSLQLYVNGATITFLFASITDAQPYTLPIAKFDEDESYADSLVNSFQSNYQLNRYFTITKSAIETDAVVFTAKQPGAEFNIQATAQFFNGLELYQDLTTVGASALYVKDRYLRADIYIEETYNSNSYIFFAEITQQIIDSNILHFDLSSRMKSYFKDKSEFNRIGYDGIIRLDNINKRYKVEFTEFDKGLYKFVQDTTTSAVLRAHKGGVKNDEYRIFPDLVEDYLKPKYKPLSWKPDRRTISKGSVEHLYYLKHFNFNNTLKCVVKLWYSDGTSNSFTDATLTALNAFESFSWNVSYARIAAKATIPANESIVQYACYWKAPNDADISEPTYFRVINSNDLDRYFYYENSFGCFELLRTNSKHTYGIDSVKGESSITLAPTAPYYQGSIEDYTFQYEEKYQGSTGNLSKQDAIVAIDFLLSTKRFLKRGSRLINIVIETSSVTTFKDASFPHGFKFNYKRAEVQHYFSNLIEIAAEQKSILGDEETPLVIDEL